MLTRLSPFSLLIFFFLIPLFSLITPSEVSAQSPKQEYTKAKVIKVISEGTKDIGTTKNNYQKLRLQFIDGAQKGKEIVLDYGGNFTLPEEKKVHVGQTVVLTTTQMAGKPTYVITDVYRIPSLFYILCFFFGLVVLLAGKKGLGAILGLVISLGIIMGFIVPQILNGADALSVTIGGSIVIMLTTIYLAHGFSQTTTIAVIATACCLLLTGLLASLFISLAQLSGLGSEDIYSLQMGFGSLINFKGLLLGGIIIGSLGVLDDTTTTQATAVAEIAKANPTMTFIHLFKRGMIIGKEHITSLVNTLVLAYAGASIGIFLFLSLSLQQNGQPLWVMLNSEALSEEIIRTLSGSIGLMLAVPFTTLLAAFFAKYSVKIN